MSEEMETSGNKYIEFLLDRFPDLKQEVQTHTDTETKGADWKALDVYERIFVPYMIRHLDRDNREEILKIADFFEDLLALNDGDFEYIAYDMLNILRKDPAGQRIRDYLKERGLAELHDVIENDDKKFNELMLDTFPSLKQEFDDYTSWQDGIDTSAGLTYEDLLVPYIEKQLTDDNREEILRIAVFIEKFLSMNDYAYNIAYVGVLEALKYNSNKEIGPKIRSFLKEKSREAYDEIYI